MQTSTKAKGDPSQYIPVFRQIYTEFPSIKRNWLYRFYSLTANLNISIEIFKYELLQVKYLFLQSLETAKQKRETRNVKYYRYLKNIIFKGFKRK